MSSSDYQLSSLTDSPPGKGEEPFVEAAPIGRLHTEVNGGVVFVNRWWSALTGQDRNRAKGDGWLEAIHPDDRQRVKNEWHAAVGDERELSVQFRVLRPDGIELVAFMRSAPVITEDEGVCGYTLVIDDVTDRVKMQEALVRSEASYRLLAEHSTDFISRHTPSGVYTYASPIVETLLGWKPEELVGTSAYEYFHPEDLTEIAASHDRVLLKPDISTVAYQIRKKDGTYTWFETTARTIRKRDNGEVIEIIAVSRDITERRQAEESDRLTHLLDAKDRFLASVSHELRTPLTSVIGFTEILRQGNHNLTDAERTDLIETLGREAADLAGIIDDLLVLTRAEHGTLSLVTVPVDLRAQTAQILESFDLADRVSIDANGATTATGDPGRIRQILRNLISNALTHGKPPLRIRITSRLDEVRVEVIDSGPGIPPEHQSVIFDAYQRLNMNPGKPDSIGLGLTVSRTLAHLMNGHLTYEPDSDSTTFVLTLSAASSATSELPAPSG